MVFKASYKTFLIILKWFQAFVNFTLWLLLLPFFPCCVLTSWTPGMGHPCSTSIIVGGRAVCSCALRLQSSKELEKAAAGKRSGPERAAESQSKKQE